MLPETFTAEDGTTLSQVVIPVAELKKECFTLHFFSPGVKSSLGLVRCVKALNLPGGQMEVAWVDGAGVQVFEGLYRTSDSIITYTA